MFPPPLNPSPCCVLSVIPVELLTKPASALEAAAQVQVLARRRQHAYWFAHTLLPKRRLPVGPTICGVASTDLVLPPVEF